MGDFLHAKRVSSRAHVFTASALLFTALRNDHGFASAPSGEPRRGGQNEYRHATYARRALPLPPHAFPCLDTAVGTLPPSTHARVSRVTRHAPHPANPGESPGNRRGAGESPANLRLTADTWHHAAMAVGTPPPLAPGQPRQTQRGRFSIDTGTANPPPYRHNKPSNCRPSPPEGRTKGPTRPRDELR